MYPNAPELTSQSLPLSYSGMPLTTYFSTYFLSTFDKTVLDSRNRFN
jgi:hypothetical protein